MPVAPDADTSAQSIKFEDEQIQRIIQKLRDNAYVPNPDVITDPESAQAIVMLHDEKGKAALESLVGRVLDGKPLLGYEKSLLKAMHENEKR